MQPIAYLNGDWIAASELRLPVTDAGFVQGVTVAEQLRTFAGGIFQLKSHLDRLSRSLQIVGVSVPGGVTQHTGYASPTFKCVFSAPLRLCASALNCDALR